MNNSEPTLNELIASLKSKGRLEQMLDNSIDYNYNLLSTKLAEIPMLDRPRTNIGTPMLTIQDISGSSPIFVNTNYFRQAAIHWIRYNCYTKAPVGSREYVEYWNEEERRCKKGLKVGNLWITGKHYFYLNYVPIKRIPSREYLQYNPMTPKNKKVWEFPAFWEIDLKWWYAKELCSQNAEMGFDQCHLSALKARRGGFSYKEAGEGVYNYNFLPNSVSGYYAATDAYLVSDGVFNKVSDMLNHLNNYTDWYKNRQKINSTYHKKASYIDGDGIEQGYMSELLAQVLDKPDKARGGDKVKITFEEGGAFPDVIKAWQICLPQVTQGGTTTGFMCIFGTGGTKNDSGLVGLETIYYDPTAYKCLAFPNTWEDDATSECGFFFPYFMGIEQAMDFNGNINKPAALAYSEKEREVLKKAKSGITIDMFIAENPNVPSEALRRPNSGIFNVTEIKKQEIKVKTSTEIQSIIKHGDLIPNGNNVEFLPKPYYEAKPVDYYPIPKDGREKEGCFTIFQTPYSIDGKIPDDMYFLVIDPYEQDEAPTSESVGAIHVVKRPNNIDPRPSDCIVACYTGRPSTVGKFYEKAFLLSNYYNAKIQSSILGGGQGLITHARNTNQLHRLYYTPEMLGSKEVMAGRNKSYFINEQRHKPTLLQQLNQWLMMPRGIKEDGEIILNLHLVYDIGFLRELQRYNDTGNFDRVSAALFIGLMLYELEQIEVQSLEAETDDFFTRPLYTNSTGQTLFGNRVLKVQSGYLSN